MPANPRSYIAPEVLDGTKKPSTASDVISFGRIQRYLSDFVDFHFAQKRRLQSLPTLMEYLLISVYLLFAAHRKANSNIKRKEQERASQQEDVPKVDIDKDREQFDDDAPVTGKRKTPGRCYGRFIQKNVSRF